MSSRFGYPNMQGMDNEQAIRSYLFQLSDKLEYEVGRLQEMIPEAAEEPSHEQEDILTGKIGKITKQIDQIASSIETINRQISSLDARVTALEQEEPSNE